MIYETFREAVQNIWSNKFRTFLTMLGIIIGVTAVIVIVGLGNGMTQSIQSSFSDLGTNIISVQVMGYGSRSVKVEDIYSLVTYGQHQRDREGGYHQLQQHQRQGRERELSWNERLHRPRRARHQLRGSD